jgi:hypothetical protein
MSDTNNETCKTYSAAIIFYSPNPVAAERLALGLVAAVKGEPIQVAMVRSLKRIIDAFPGVDDEALGRFRQRAFDLAKEAPGIDIKDYLAQLLGLDSPSRLNSENLLHSDSIAVKYLADGVTYIPSRKAVSLFAGLLGLDAITDPKELDK